MRPRVEDAAGTRTDAELIAASASASASAGELFAGLFDRHGRTVHRYLARRAGPAAAEDLLAQTFLVAFETRGRYDGERAEALPWLSGIATNVLRRARRDEARRYRALARTGVDADVACPADRVAEHVDARAATAALAGALASLAPGDRDVLLLVAWGGLGQDEVAPRPGPAPGHRQVPPAPGPHPAARRPADHRGDRPWMSWTCSAGCAPTPRSWTPSPSAASATAC